MKKKEEKLDEIKEKEHNIVDTQKKKKMSIRKASITKEIIEILLNLIKQY